MSKFENEQAAIEYMYQRPHSDKAGTVDRMKMMLDKLNHPELNMPKLIHVTGTNGKGSTANMISAILSESGKKTGLFVSPFIKNFRERIQINGKMIEKSELVKYVEQVANESEDLSDICSLTFFEFLTLVMILKFSNSNLDAAVIEVGIGGRNDATNVLPTAKLAVISSIGLDHVDILGNTIEAIAYEKSGIIHEGMEVVVGDLPAQALPFFPHAIHGKLDEFQSNLKGDYQRYNTALAVAAVRVFDSKITDQTIQSALDKVNFPCRYEWIMSQNQQFILDGAHNAQGLKALINNLKQEQAKISVVFASLEDKNAIDLLPDLLALENVEKVIAVAFSGMGSRQAVNVSGLQLKYPEIEIAQDWQSAVKKLNSEIILLTGSLYFVSQVREKLINEA